MKIEFLQDHLYFKKGQKIELADFTVLTGRNGAGKTNLLRALGNKEICQIDGELNKTIDSSFYDFDSFYHFSNDTRYGIFSGGDSAMNQTWRDLLAYRKGLSKPTPQIIQQAEDCGKSVDELTKVDFINTVINRIDDRSKLFELKFYKDSALYRGYQEKNKFNAFRNAEYGEDNLVYSEKEFLNSYGTPPWERINNIFEELGLNYEFFIPKELARDEAVEVKLTDKVNGQDVEFKNLSPGERTILSLTTIIYNSDFKSTLPKLFIFDEPDALLHPEYSKKLIYIFNEYIVKKLGVRVIMTTHSPSTVAVAPEESIFICEKKFFKVRKVSKDEALRQLTLNVNSLSILHENRRQVFVEDESDAKIFEFIYLKLSTKLHPEISLNFIPVKKSSVGGCDKVREITKALYDGGNKTVFGIIDWDNKNNSNDYIFVLGEGKRHSIENYVLDPVLIYAFLLWEKIVPNVFPNEMKEYSLRNFGQISNNDLQVIVNGMVQYCIELKQDDASEGNLQIGYLNGMIAEIPKWFIEVNGHKLEEFLQNKFLPIRRVEKRKSEKLVNIILHNIMEDFPEFIPMEFLELFKKIQTKT